MRPDLGPCWLWRRARNVRHGYGAVRIAGKNRRAHIVAFEFDRGPVPPGLVLDHLCRNRPCVRPDHLEPVTQQVNCQRGMTGRAPGCTGERNKLKTHCARGHAYADDNLYIHRNRRHCRTCRRLNDEALRRGVST